MRKKYTVIILSALFLAPSVAFALGLSASPSSVEMETVTGIIVEENILVTNTSQDVALFDVYPDELGRVIEVSPSSFTLEAGEEKKVLLSVESQEEGVFTTNISIVARALSDNVVSAGGGIKIPFLLSVGKANTAQFAGIGGTSIFDSFTVGLTALLIILNLAMLLYLQVRKVLSRKER